jgi:endonuclease YncB( thermonuclease family)
VRAVVFSIITLLGISVVSCRFTESSKATGDWSMYDQKPFFVRHVIDGDTLEIEPTPGGQPTKIRLIGVDAPEVKSYWADASTRYAVARAHAKPVVIRLEPTRTRDRYGRLLAYVYLSDRESLNFALVRDGQAYADRRFRHTMGSQFEQAENAARKKGTGLWKDVREQQMPPWRQRWLAERATAGASR